MYQNEYTWLQGLQMTSISNIIQSILMNSITIKDFMTLFIALYLKMNHVPQFEYKIIAYKNFLNCSLDCSTVTIKYFMILTHNFPSGKSLQYACEPQTWATRPCTPTSRSNLTWWTVTTSPLCGTTNCTVPFMWKRTRCPATRLLALKQGLSYAMYVL